MICVHAKYGTNKEKEDNYNIHRIYVIITKFYASMLILGFSKIYRYNIGIKLMIGFNMCIIHLSKIIILFQDTRANSVDIFLYFQKKYITISHLGLSLSSIRGQVTEVVCWYAYFSLGPHTG